MNYVTCITVTTAKSFGMKVSLPAARIAEREEVLVPVDERALEQCVELYVDLPRQSLAIKGFPALLQRQLRFT